MCDVNLQEGIVTPQVKGTPFYHHLREGWICEVADVFLAGGKPSGNDGDARTFQLVPEASSEASREPSRVQP